MLNKISICLMLPLLVAGCSDSDNTANTGAVYAMTNNAQTNSIVAYSRAADGSLSLIGTTNSEGRGTGPNNVASGPGANAIDPLASNYSLVMSSNNRFVFAVNAGSDQVSSFAVNANRSLTHVSTVATGGTDPVSIATNNNTVFVANSNAGVGSITSFDVSSTGVLSRTGAPAVALSGRPTAIVLSKDNTSLITSLVNTLQLQVFSVSGSALAQTQLYEYPASAANRNVSNPFGLATYARNGSQFVIVGEARVFAAGATDASPQTSSVSTFSLSGGQLTLVSDDIRVDSDGDDATGPIATCWVVTNDEGTLAFTANTNHNSMSTFALNGVGIAALRRSLAFVEEGVFTEDGLTDQVAIGDVVYQLTARSGNVISLRANATTGALTEFDRETGDLSALGGNQGITGF